MSVCILVIHHSGKNQDAGMRGSSALLGAADQVLEVRQERGSRTVRVYKSRDAGKGIEIDFELKTVELGLDADGDAITSCVLTTVLTNASGRFEPPPKPSGANQRRVFQALWDMLPEVGRPGIKPAPDDRPSVSLDELIERAAGLLTCEPRRAPERVRSAVNPMAAANVLLFQDGRVWLPSWTSKASNNKVL
ncbi:hypothetical protein H0A65_04690 [Alcaligenaceae bacterium]|nr:hypothetical protein [Alcaligenaceae bacterium]